jgi:hypothetical protein
MKTIGTCDIEQHGLSSASLAVAWPIEPIGPIGPMNGEDKYSPELEARDPFFDRATQAELRRRIEDVRARRNLVPSPRKR